MTGLSSFRRHRRRHPAPPAEVGTEVKLGNLSQHAQSAARERACSVGMRTTQEVPVEPTDGDTEHLLYSKYSVGRVAACPRCGMHIERDGGCASMTCTQCNTTLKFEPFGSLAQVEEEAA